MSKYDAELGNLSLGKETSYHYNYDPTLLQAVPRELNRKELNIVKELPFSFGEDLWTLYEISWLNENGLPQVAIGDISVPFNSKNIIESKSFKLYLNGFNQTKFPNWQTVITTLQRDLSECAQGNVNINLHKLDDENFQDMVTWQGTCIDNQSITIDQYEYDDTLLTDCTSTEKVEERLYSHLLKSNCLITHQPDWGSLYIKYSGNKISHDALLRYIISYRQHNEFHEQCVERIFSDLMKFAKPEKLLVYARYTRRGGLDINPYRANYECKLTNRHLIRQ